MYARLIQAGVDVRAYTPSALHAKVAVVDGQWATVGSSNLDPLSLLPVSYTHLDVYKRQAWGWAFWPC